jgi:hypothetical protein
MSVSPRDLRQRWEAAGQGHVFGFWDELNCEQQEKLLRQLRVRIPSTNVYQANNSAK